MCNMCASLLLGAPAQQDMTIINTTVKGKLFLCLSTWLAEEQADISPAITYRTDVTKNGRLTWLTILIVDMELRRLQILYEIGSCLETARKKHLGVMSTNTHIIPLLAWWDPRIRIINLSSRKRAKIRRTQKTGDQISGIPPESIDGTRMEF